ALDLTAGGDITQAGAWVVAGTTALDAGANDITANNALNQFTTLEFNGATVEIRDSAGGLVLSGGNATTSATVTTVSSLGQTGALTIANGDFRVQGGGTVFLNDGGNDFDQVSVRGWTPLGFTNAGQIIVRDADGLQLDNMSTSSLLTVRAAGHVTQGAGTTISAGVSTSLIDATGFNVTLNNATNDFNVFRANAANVTVQDTDGISLSQSTVTDSMTVTAGGAINQSTAGSAAISITNSLTVDSGAFDVSLQHAGNDIGALAIVDARHVSLVDQGSLALGDASNGVSMTGNLDIEAGLGTLTQADVVSVDGATTINVGGANTNVTLDDAGNHFGGTVTFSNTAGGSFHDIALADDGDLHVSGFGASGDVDFTAKGALTQAAAWAVAGDMSATARDGATTFGITLDSTNAFNAITLDGSNVSVTEGDGFAFSVAGSTVTGTMSVTSSGSVTDNGALTVGGVATFTLGATSDLILDGANVDFQDAVNVTAGRDVTIADATDDLSIGAITVTGAVDLDASGAILDGSLAEGAGAENIVANTIDLTAVDGIGTAGDRLDTDAQSAVPGVSLSVGVTGTGGVYLNETGVANVGGTVNDGDFDYLSNGNIFIASITADATDDTVTLTTTNGNIDDMNDDADLDVQAFDIVLDAGTGNIGGNALAGAGTDPEGLIELDGNTTLTGNNIAVADVAVGAGDRVLDVTASGSFAYSYGSDIYIDLITAGGDLTLISTGGSIYDQQDDTTADIVLTDATRSVTLTADANIGGRSQGNPAPGNARIEIQDAATISADANGGNVLLHSADAVTLDDVEATGNIDITVNGNTEIDSVVAVGDVTLNVAGAITDTNATASNIGGQDVTLTATGAIGSATNRIGTSADTLDVSVETNPGGIFINETNGVTLTDIDTVNGVIDIEAGGAMTVTDVRSIGALEANDVTLQGTAMTVHDIQTAGAGDVFLTATTGAIIDGNGATNNISTDLLTATAQNGISLDTNVTGIALNVTGAGNIDIDENNNLSATASTANGSITITAAGVMAANTVSAGGSADNDDVSLTATSIGVGAVSAAGAGDVTLSATAGAIADTNGATTNVSGDTLIVSAATGINLDTQINAGQFTGGGAGDLDISEANDFTLSTASVVNGKITIASGGETTLQTDLATSGRDIVLVGDVVLAGNRSISTGAGAGSVRVDDINGNGNDLVLNAGTGDVISSGMQNVGKLEVTAENWNTHGAMSVASHDFSGLDGNNWIMDGDTALTISTGNLDLSGFGSIRAASNGSAGLELEAVSGNISATDVDVGNGGSLKHLSMTGRELSLGRVTTSGDQDYKGEATIGSTLSSTGGSILFDGRLELASNAGVSAGKDVVFGNVVDGARDLAITAGGSVRFSDAVGSTTALRNLSITADAVTVHAVRTSGSQEYHAAATVQGNLEARGITFGKSVSFPGGALLVGEILTGFIITVLLTFFFLKDGPRMWQWLVAPAAPERRAVWGELGSRIFVALGGYVRGIAF
ncbi:MAG: hypothetical protein KY410_04775, partial [Proteobacteria bacterium]|nr:hypothetical protein [Pseudomonadota bacterium]